MLEGLIHRQRDDRVWRKIPWNDAEFSRRMLREHLSQEHDAASRRLPQIDAAVAWIHDTILGGRRSTVLDLGCGPGFYVHRLAKLGHTCTGIDFGPASIDYARTHHAGTFILADIVTADYGEGLDLICLIYGELNAFAPDTAQRIIAKAHRALKPGGALLLEISRFDAIARTGQEPPTWYTQEAGLFADTPHLVLQESSFEESRACSWYYVVDAATGSLEEFVAMHQAYTDEEYADLLRGFAEIRRSPSLTGDPQGDGEFFVLVATK